MTINRTLADLSVADQATAEAGTNNTEYMTPLRAKQSIVANSTPSGTKDFVASGTLPDGSTVVLNSDGTVSVVTGVVESMGTATVFESATSYYISVTPISATQVVIAYRDVGNSDYGTAIVGTVSGTSISFGTATVFESAISNYISVTSISATQVVIGYNDGGNSSYSTAIVGTISGTSISFGTATVFESASSYYISVTPISATQVVIGYNDGGNSDYGTAIVGTISGTSISFGTATVFESAASNHISVTPISATQVVIGYNDGGNSGYGTAITYNLPSTDSADFIGITAEAIADAATGTVTLLGGVNSSQSGLTIGTDYYVANDGTLTTTANSVPAGKAVSATELLITGGV
jgi:urease beta subunit